MVLILSTLPLTCSFSRSMPVGSKAPDFVLPSLADPSMPLHLAEINKDHPVLLVFWATWCPNCVEEIPQLNEWQEKKSARGLRILAVNVEESREDVLAFVKKQPVHYPVALDEKGQVASQYKLAGIPVALYLEKGGEILYYGFQLPKQIDPFLEQRRA